MKFIQPNMERCLSVTLFHFFFLDYRRARSVCFTCTSYEMETTEHLLIHCSFSWRLWTKYMTWWGIIFWCLSKSLDSLLFKWYLMVFINFQKKVWQVLLFFFWHYLDIQINLHASWLWTKFITWWGIFFWCISKSLDSLLFEWSRIVFRIFQKKA
jgi:hypothetical protein